MLKERLKRISWQTVCSWSIGLGMIFFVWHNTSQPFIDIIFIPHLGMMMIFAGIVFTMIKTPFSVLFARRDKWLDPVLIILCTCIIASGIQGYIESRLTLTEMYSAIAIGLMLIGCYYTCRYLGDSVFKPMAVAVIVESISIVVYGATHGWKPNGGLLSFTNYDIAIGLLFFGLLTTNEKWQKWLVPFVVLGVYFSGAAEGLFVAVVLGLVWFAKNYVFTSRVITRRDWITIGATAAIFAVIVPFTYEPIWSRNLGERVVALIQAFGSSNPDPLLDFATGYRWMGNWHLTMPIKLFGYGININHFYVGIPHNIVLIIIEQCGFIALVAWFTIWLILIKKFSWHYRWAWIGMLLMGVFDHFIWTEACIWFWCLAGATVAQYTQEVQYVRGH
jgi:hypothetical protein